MTNRGFLSVSGIIQSVSPMQNQCCQQMINLRTSNGPVTLILSNDTYVVNNTRLRQGMHMVAFYDANAPVPLIYPPQYQVSVVAQQMPGETITYDFFDQNLLNSDGTLKLNIARTTEIITPNGQIFNCSLQNRMMIVFYGSTTRSIPAQTTPRKLIVMC